jgi:transposase
MNLATESRKKQILVWLVWAVACIVFFLVPDHSTFPLAMHRPALEAVVLHDDRDGPLFPWQSRTRLRKRARERLRAWRQAQRRAKWVKRLARLALNGALSFAWIVDQLTAWQLRRRLGALPVLYALLEILQVREVINRYCPTKAEIDHGLVAIVLILNRLDGPRPLYQVSQWLAQTVLVCTLGVPAEKFNDDRLARTLDAISPHCREIWQEIVHRALIRFDIDLSFIFYDLTAFTVHGEYEGSELIDFGFAHNTPMDKRKVKAGLNVTADGNVPVDYRPWSGRTADKATVQENMARLCRLLHQRGWSTKETVVVGDRANLNDELALAYDDHGLRYLAGLQTQKKAHRELLMAIPNEQFLNYPLTAERGREGHWGIPCQVPFEHDGRRVVHRGLVVISGPMRSAMRRTRAKQLRELRQELQAVTDKIGQPYYRTVKSVQRRADTRLKNSPVGKLVRAQAYTDSEGQVSVRWWRDRTALWEAKERDGRYLLVTNDWSLSPQQMLSLYREKDGVEKRFRVSKSDLQVSPIYLHKDHRIEAMLLINMLALLTYSLLERQVRQSGIQMTARAVIETLETLDVIETHCRDGSCLFRLTPINEDQAELLVALADILNDLRMPKWPHPQLPQRGPMLWALPPPAD